MARRRVVLPQRKHQQSGDSGKEARLQKMVGQGRQICGDHCELSFLASLRSAFSASCTSSKVSLPDSTKCDITGWVRPPNNPNRSSIKRRWAAFRETTASKI